MTTEVMNFKRRMEGLETSLRNKQIEKNDKLEIFEAQLNKLNKDFNTFNNSIQIIKNCEVFAKEISVLKEKTNTLALQVKFYHNIQLNMNYFR